MRVYAAQLHYNVLYILYNVLLHIYLPYYIINCIMYWMTLKYIYIYIYIYLIYIIYINVHEYLFHNNIYNNVLDYISAAVSAAAATAVAAVAEDICAAFN